MNIEHGMKKQVGMVKPAQLSPLFLQDILLPYGAFMRE